MSVLAEERRHLRGVVDPYMRECPTCFAPVGALCIDLHPKAEGVLIKGVHVARLT